MIGGYYIRQAMQFEVRTDAWWVMIEFEKNPLIGSWKVADLFFSNIEFGMCSTESHGTK